MSTKNMGLPFSNPIGDSLELMKKMWGFAGLPGIPTAGNLASMAARIPQQLPSMLAPTLDVDELEKRIADLRAVEQWLELNASILRTTIQSLEVQRATIATLKGISGAMLGPIFNKAGPSPAPPEVRLGLAAMQAEESKAAEIKNVAPPSVGPAKKARKSPTRAGASSMAAAAAVNPTAWWTTLQDQFNRIAATAAGQAVTPMAATAKSAKPAKKAKKGAPRAAKSRGQ